jgi:ribonuclease HI
MIKRNEEKQTVIQYYTDGSCEPNPGTGGFAVIKNMQPHILGGDFDTTNIRMEGRAIIEALKDAAGEPCEIYSDSEFWIKVITIWSLPWEKNGWRKKGGEIKNLDIVKEVCPLYRNSKAQLIWVRGHNKDKGNELADEHANRARVMQLKKERGTTSAGTPQLDLGI